MTKSVKKSSKPSKLRWRIFSNLAFRVTPSPHTVDEDNIPPFSNSVPGPELGVVGGSGVVAPRPAKPRFADDDCVGGGGGRDSKDFGCLLDPLLGTSLELNSRL